MTNSTIKLKHIFLRFLVAEVLFTAVYSVTNYWFFMRTNWQYLSESWTNVAIPIFICWIPVVVFIIPRLRLLSFQRSYSKNPRLGYGIIITGAFIFTMISSQLYLTSATGKLTVVDSVNNARKTPATKFYTVRQHYVKQNEYYTYGSWQVTGKYDDHLDLTYFIVCPIYANATDTLRSAMADTARAWIGACYFKGLHSKKTDSINQAMLLDFETQSLKQFQQTNINDFVYLARLKTDDTHYINYRRAIRAHYGASINNPMVFEGHSQPFANRAKGSLFMFTMSFFVGAILFLLLSVAPPLNDDEAAKLKRLKFDRTR